VALRGHKAGAVRRVGIQSGSSQNDHRLAANIKVMRTAIALLLIGAGSLQAADLVLTGATLYEAPDVPPIAAAIVTHGTHIAGVGARASMRIPDDAQVVDCSGKFITAGFWNSHVHILTPVLLHARNGSAADMNRELDSMLNRWGFTTVFDVASVRENVLALRNRIESGEVRGPRILTVGEPILTEVPIYVRDYLAANHISMPVVTTPEEAVARVVALARGGADGIKLFTGSLQGARVENMPLAMVKAATGEAHRYHLPVFAHPQNLAGMELAIDGGVDILAHTVPDSPPWSPGLVARLKRNHMALIPTLTLFDFEARKGAVSDSDRNAWIAKMVAELRTVSQDGGEVLFGTDIGYTDHFDTALEFTLMARAGMSFGQILASLTTAPAKRFGVSSRSGRVARGMDADFVVLDDDPTKDITALSRVRLVVRAGRIVYKL
jgi:imidazolonepropionase-like amidohydrolase